MDLSHAPVPTQKPAPVNLRDPPKWLKRPCGASFAVSMSCTERCFSRVQFN